MARPRIRPLLAAAAATAALAFAACGEKQEPDLADIPPPPQPDAPQAPKGLPTSVKGRWAGQLRQKGVKPFPIQVSIASATDPDQNVVRYGGQINCSGTWRYLDATGPKVMFREVIDRGKGGRCKGVGAVTVKTLAGEPARLSYEFRGGGVSSSGTLHHP